MLFRNGRTSIQASGSSSIIELVPDGTMVTKDQVICQLDSSEYEELVRQQQIELQEDSAECEGVRLDLESLEIQLREYRDGLFVQLKEQYQGQIALAQADLQRQQDKLAWSERMAEIGYLPLSRLRSEQQLLLQTEIALNRAQLAYDNLVKYTAPKTILTLEGRLDGMRAQLSYHETRVQRDEEQLVFYQEQVDHCTIRAPHDGFLIYANERDNDTQIELGSRVRENQDLFYLPNLAKMEIQTELHETVVDRVREGMPVRIVIEALPDVELEGDVISVAPLPMSKRSWTQSDDVKNFLGRIRLHAVPEGLLPGMTAMVDILTASQSDTLVIPPQALAVVDGREVCYVTVPGGVERRVITVGAYHPQMLEILGGLAEGEEVVLAPDEIQPDLVVDTSPRVIPVENNGTIAAADESVQPTL